MASATQSSNADLILNADGAGNEIIMQQNGVEVGRIGAGGMGKVLQVVHGRQSDNRYTTTSTAWTSLGSTLSITPKSATSKILIRYISSISMQGGTAYFDIARDGTQNISGALNGIVSSNTSTFQSLPVEFIDSPNTTSQVTYGMSTKVTAGTLYLNDANENTYTSIVIMEIGV